MTKPLARTILRLPLLLIAAFAASCTLDAEPAPPETPTLENCARLGGYVQRVGLLGREACVVEYKDKGKPCTDGSQCEGDCWGEARNYAPDEPAVGKCQPTNMPFGCNSRVTNGVASPVLCVD
jgi:hypothetical protein